jgi:hypothetical protein
VYAFLNQGGGFNVPSASGKRGNVLMIHITLQQTSRFPTLCEEANIPQRKLLRSEKEKKRITRLKLYVPLSYDSEKRYTRLDNTSARNIRAQKTQR